MPLFQRSKLKDAPFICRIYSSRRKRGGGDHHKPNVVELPSLSDEKGLTVHMICHAERPYSEYVFVSPDNYVDRFTYSDYLKNYKPIIVEPETV